MSRYSYFTNVLSAVFCSDNFKICDVVTNTLLSVKAISYFCLHSALIYINALIINE